MMRDDFHLSSETRALAKLAGRVLNATLDTAVEGVVEGFEAEVDAAMIEARPAFADDDA